jgi:hypothetical protein
MPTHSYLFESPNLVLEVEADFVGMLLHIPSEDLLDGLVPALGESDADEDLGISVPSSEKGKEGLD